MLHGRREPCAAVDRLLAGARDARGGALLLRGEPGIGKSALLAYAAERAAADPATAWRVLRASGVESEAELPFAGLHQLLRPVLDRIDRLVPGQRAALGGALGGALGDGGAGDRFLVSVAALNLLSEAADSRPLLCLIDDAQWIDQPSADALVFAARRLDAEPIALAFAGRDGFAAAGVPELTLPPLDTAAAAALLGDGRLPAGVLARLVAVTGGNPLALRELPGSLTADQLAGRAPVDDRLPLPTRLEQVFGERVRGLPAATRTLLVVAAAEETGDVGVVLAATARITGDPAAATENALDEAERAGLLRVGTTGIEFRHPLVRSAAYQVAGFTAQRAAHRALATTFAGADQADLIAWHRAAAALGPDEDVAAALERSAERAAWRGGHAAATAALRRAAEMSADEAARARRLVAAAGSAWRSGRHLQARELLDRAGQDGTDLAVRISAEHLRGTVEADSGNALAAAQILIGASELAAAADPTTALQTLVEAAEAAAYAGDSGRTADLGRRAATLPVEDKPAVFMSDMLTGMGRVAEGDSAAGAAVLRRALAVADHLDQPRHLTWAGVAASFVGDEPAARTWFTRAAERARETGAIGELPHALEYLAELDLRTGRYGPALAHATEGLTLARDIGQDTSIGRHLATIAFVSALQGAEEDCRTHAREALTRAAARGLGIVAAVATHALAMLDLGLGRPAEALAHLHAMLTARSGEGSPFLAVFCVPDLVEAAARAGRWDGVPAAVAAFEQIAGPSGAPAARAILARIRALLPEGDPAGHFDEALRHGRESHRPFELARTQLLYGEHLRRAKRRTEARDQLRAALETFDLLGAVPWADRARTELRATGETARKRDPSTLSRLTPQERQIVRLVAEGATNQQVAARLFISKRTVEYHLHNVFTKLGISSRTGLIRLQLDD